jgi:hypothetical protein
LFPQRSRLSDDRRSIFLPNGQSIPFGEKVTLTFVSRPTNETWPGKPQHDETCGPNPVLGSVDTYRSHRTMAARVMTAR